ncbi:cyclase family protein [Microbacterium alcoholitolerans]|uniref:cyclase family protein n=1 Tax=unclassified Microbacterium TaxID=2609290 RepID=UPI003D1750D3
MTEHRSPELPRKGAKLLRKPYRLVDLTNEIYQGMPIYPVHQKPYIMVNHTHAESVERLGAQMPFRSHNLLMSEHTGTHTDAIFEYDEHGPSLSESPLEFYYGPAICWDVSHVRYPDYITADVLREAEARADVKIREGDIVLLYTGHNERTWPRDEYLKNYTGLSTDGAEWLAERGVINIGIDGVSIDHYESTDDRAHVVCGRYQIVNTEGLANLGAVKGMRFQFHGLPLRIRNGTGSPVRAVAVLTE